MLETWVGPGSQLERRPNRTIVDVDTARRYSTYGTKVPYQFSRAERLSGTDKPSASMNQMFMPTREGLLDADQCGLDADTCGHSE